MATPVSNQMFAAYARMSSRANQLRREGTWRLALTDFDEFQLEVKNEFLLGAHSEYVKDVIKQLQKNVGAQQKIADALGLKDRTSISQMLRSGKMDGVRLTAAFHQFGLTFSTKTREKATYSGFANATAFLNARIHPDDSGETITSRDFADLAGIFASDEWDDALRSPNPQLARAVAVRIVSESDSLTDGPNRVNRLRPEQCVRLLTDVYDTWADPGAMALFLIPECIPTDSV